MEKKAIILMGLFLLIISIFSAVAEEPPDDSELIPIDDFEPEPTLYEEPVPELIDEEVESIPEEVDDAVEVLPEEEAISETEDIFSGDDQSSLSSDKSSLISRGISFGIRIAKAGINKARGLAGWVITRDYVSSAKNIARFLLGLSIWLKILIVFFGIIFLLILWSYLFKDTRANNLRRARKHHRKGERAHNRGREEKADQNYAKAAEYREKAQDQW